MKRLAILALGTTVWAAPLYAALQVGATAPDFTTQATLAGKPFSFALADALKHGPVVLYFYPAAFTPGCTVEAHEFAEATDKFKALGATVIGVSHEEQLASADAGGVPRPSLGLTVEKIDKALARQLDLDETAGVIVAEVDPGGPGEAAGLRPHDIIMEVDRRPVKNLDGWRRALDRAAGEKITLLLVKRDGHSYSEAARLSGLSIHTIEKYVVEARARLRVLLAAREPARRIRHAFARDGELVLLGEAR